MQKLNDQLTEHLVELFYSKENEFVARALREWDKATGYLFYPNFIKTVIRDLWADLYMRN